jgi:hypothetical protein
LLQAVYGMLTRLVRARVWHVGVLAEQQRNGADSKAYQPSAYVRGSVDTFKAEATDITAKGTNHGVLAHKAPPVALKSRKAATSKLAMMDGEPANI